MVGSKWGEASSTWLYYEEIAVWLGWTGKCGCNSGLKRGVNGLWKKGKASQKDYKVAVKLCREKSTMIKAWLKIHLASAVKDKKKCFYKYINKRRTKDNLYPSLDAGGNRVIKDKERTEVLNTFFMSVFSSMTSCSLASQPPWAGIQW